MRLFHRSQDYLRPSASYDKNHTMGFLKESIMGSQELTEIVRQRVSRNV